MKTSLSFDKAVTDIGNGADGEIIELPEGAMVLPGFIDIHIHGAGGYDTMDASEEALSNIAEVTVKNIIDFSRFGECKNKVCYDI